MGESAVHRSMLVTLGRSALLFVALAVAALLSAACYVKTTAARLAHEYSRTWSTPYKVMEN